MRFLYPRPGLLASPAGLVNSAVEWAVKTSYIKNVDSARVSMPDQVVRCSPDDMDDPSMKWVCQL